jgi:hypothetical protein
MRLWSIHPKYLDRQGLLAVWREALLAQKVLAGQTKGYRYHPQLDRFRRHETPMKAIGVYLHHIVLESKRRNYHFDKSKIQSISLRIKQIKVTKGQLEFERKHLLTKLRLRDSAFYSALIKTQHLKLHPLFLSITGNIEPWEKHS